MIELLFTLSIIVNIFLVWYIVQLLRRFLAFQEDLDSFTSRLKEYEVHVETVNNLERFYGDETLGNLLRHSKNMAQECNQFQYYIIGQEEEHDEEEHDEEER